MTFQCVVGPHTSDPGEKETKIVSKKRDRTYQLPGGGVSYGWEIVKEDKYCPLHAAIKKTE